MFHNADSLRRANGGVTAEEEEEGTGSATPTAGRASGPLSSNQSNPVDEKAKDVPTLPVPSSGGVDAVCCNYQGRVIY